MEKNPASRAPHSRGARKRVLLTIYKPPKNDCLDAEREPSNVRLPEVGTQRQTDRQNYVIDAVLLQFAVQLL